MTLQIIPATKTGFLGMERLTIYGLMDSIHINYIIQLILIWIFYHLDILNLHDGIQQIVLGDFSVNLTFNLEIMWSRNKNANGLDQDVCWFYGYGVVIFMYLSTNIVNFQLLCTHYKQQDQIVYYRSLNKSINKQIILKHPFTSLSRSLFLLHQNIIGGHKWQKLFHALILW